MQQLVSKSINEIFIILHCSKDTLHARPSQLWLQLRKLQRNTGFTSPQLAWWISEKSIAPVMSSNTIQLDYFHHLLVWNTFSVTNWPAIVEVTDYGLESSLNMKCFLQFYFCNLLGCICNCTVMTTYKVWSQQWVVFDYPKCTSIYLCCSDISCIIKPTKFIRLWFVL